MRREVLAELGGFDERYRISSDLELFLRAKRRWPFVHLDRALTHFALGGLSTRRHDRVAAEMAAILRQHGYSPAFVAAFWLAERSRGLGVTLLPAPLRRLWRRLRG